MVDPKSHINTGITDSTANIFNTEAETCRLVTWPSSPPGTRGPAARAATASMAGLRSPIAAPRMSLTATQLALSITIDWAFSHRCVSREGDTASSSSFLLTATSFLLEEGKKHMFQHLSGAFLHSSLLSIWHCWSKCCTHSQKSWRFLIWHTCVHCRHLSQAPEWSRVGGVRGLLGSGGKAALFYHVYCWLCQIRN